MIKNIVFDIGKVLKGWHPDMERFFEPPIAEKVYHAIWGSGWWDEMDRGVIGEEELMRRMVAEAPDCEEQIRYILDHLALISERYDYAIPWVKELKSQGYQVYFLSNYSRRLRIQVPQTIDFIPYMDGGVFSSDVKLMKPDPAIYLTLCRKYNLKAEECLFLDDRQENVDGAIAVGMQAYCFTGYAESKPAIGRILAQDRFC